MRGPFFAIALTALSLGTGAGSALAQDGPVYDGTLLTTCLAAKEDGARADCIGVASDACMAQAAGQTTVGMVQCLRAELDDWDQRLNATYGRLQKEQKALDAELAALGSAVEPEREKWLTQMQRDWIAFRDSSCRFDAAQWAGGSGSGPSHAACMLMQTGRQALFLENYLAKTDSGSGN